MKTLLLTNPSGPVASASITVDGDRCYLCVKTSSGRFKSDTFKKERGAKAAFAANLMKGAKWKEQL